MRHIVMDQNEINNVLCDPSPSADRKVPKDIGYQRNDITNLDDAWGVAVTGVMLGHSITSYGLDQLFPSEVIDSFNYDRGLAQKEEVDWCLIHRTSAGKLYYRGPSPCFAFRAYYQAKREVLGSTLSSKYIIERSFGL